MYAEEAAKLQEIIDDSESIVFFGGAGVSTESGIPDFRSADGLYHQKYGYPPEEIVSHNFFCTEYRGVSTNFTQDDVLVTRSQMRLIRLRRELEEGREAYRGDHSEHRRVSSGGRQ